MAASIKGAPGSIEFKANPESVAHPSWFVRAAEAAKDEEKRRVVKHVGIGAALGTAGVLLYQHFAG